MTHCVDTARRPDEQRLVDIASILAAGMLRGCCGCENASRYRLPKLPRILGIPLPIVPRLSPGLPLPKSEYAVMLWRSKYFLASFLSPAGSVILWISD